MTTFLQKVAAAQGKFLWLEDTDYAGALLAGGSVPWLDVGGFVAWRRHAQQLLKSDVVVLTMGRLCAAWLARDTALQAAMSVRSRTNFPLKTLLGSADLRRHAAELLTGLRASFPNLPLALVCPSPRAWIREAYTAAFGPSAEVEVCEDEVDSAALHCADFLREFGTSGIDTVLLEESVESEPATLAEFEWYRSVFNVAAHYRWDMGLLAPGPRFAGAPPGGVGYLIAARPSNVACFGVMVAPEFWSWESAVRAPPADFQFAVVPLGIQPEVILDRLARLR